MFDDRVYKRGALTLHAIRGLLGARFFEMLRDWTAAYRWGVVSTEDFTTHAQRYTDADLTALIDTWVYAKPLPPITASAPGSRPGRLGRAGDDRLRTRVGPDQHGRWVARAGQPKRSGIDPQAHAKRLEHGLLAHPQPGGRLEVVQDAPRPDGPATSANPSNPAASERSRSRPIAASREAAAATRPGTP